MRYLSSIFLSTLLIPYRPHTDSINAWAKNGGRRNGLTCISCSLRLWRNSRGVGWSDREAHWYVCSYILSASCLPRFFCGFLIFFLS